MTFPSSSGMPPQGTPPYGSGYPSSSAQGVPGQPLPIYYPGAAAPAPNSALSIVSLIFGISGFCVLPFIGSLVAVITGHMALAEVARLQRNGRGMAIAGLVLGYIGLIGTIAVGIFIVMFSYWIFGVST